MTAAELAVRTAYRFHRLAPYSNGTRSMCSRPITGGDQLPVEQVPDELRCRRCWNRREGARLERSSMAARIGVRAMGGGPAVCDRCDEPIVKEQRIVRRGEHWIHAACASGADQ